MSGPESSGFAAALARLPSVQKSARGAPAYSRFVNRRAGGILAAGAYHLGLSPNVVTAVSAVCTFAGVATIALVEPAPLVGLLVCAALVLGYALDSADGQLARLRGGGSPAGEWLDHVVDAAKLSALHLAVLVAGYRFFDLPAGHLLVPIGFTVVAAVLFFGMTLNDQLRRVHGARRAESARPSVVRSLLVVPTDYGVLCLAFLLYGFRDVFAVTYGLLFLANLAFLLMALPKWFTDMAGLAPAGGGNDGTGRT
ncbi:CDP-alcohol phosphatidyltransferase [Amycolatopsis arida]|uniref:CDP-alcohol phosphatidyltransferase n=1 Tax=Amycolatopsis arida TaxID=587909 RepID=A0A1I5Z6Q0_9PSEU|nr:CDP-alcohol phosphatidyltransferase family protein [Amycolatopsis arida]TDX90184.1 CDP-alcohol phosphatidyltransferase-like enzyme [Amycolatopsis arida]SFQ52143.1 CDP-alcohol phosphatidyltransferase [Amycolatopsis arida]